MIETHTEAVQEPTGNKARLARVYAEALHAVATQGNQADAIGEELSAIAFQLMQPNSAIASFLNSVAITRNSKQPMLEAAFSGNSSPLFQQFVGVLNHNNRLGLLREIAQSYNKIQDVKAGRVRVRVTSATPLSDEQTDNLKKTLTASLNKTPILNVVVDAELLGGLIVQVGDRVYDTSVRTRLETLRNHLLSSGTYVV